MRVIITRHGETIENRDRIVQGHLPGTLSELGMEQARDLAKRLEGISLDAIYSSDLRRALDTAREVAILYPGIPFMSTEDLRERNFGRFQGMYKSDIGLNPHESTSTHEFDDESVETKSQMKERGEKFIDYLFEEGWDNVLCVGHSCMNRALIGIIRGYPTDGIFDMVQLYNTSVTIYDVGKDRRFEKVLFNFMGYVRSPSEVA